MNSVMISVHPKWCEAIIKGDKLVEIRKSMPKLKPPFKVYIYCTKGRKHSDNLWILHDDGIHRLGNGRVVAEFICDRITPFRCWEGGTVQFWNFAELNKSGLTYEEVFDYIGANNTGYSWHISNLVVNKPLDISHFRRVDSTYNTALGWAFDESAKTYALNRPPQSWIYVLPLSQRRCS